VSVMKGCNMCVNAKMGSMGVGKIGCSALEICICSE
jgi:hypothetical protein